MEYSYLCSLAHSQLAYNFNPKYTGDQSGRIKIMIINLVVSSQSFPQGRKKKEYFRAVSGQFSNKN